jgi:methylthioribose-1-phosphate isomerase
MPRTDLVLVGADALRREGVVNKIGTYMLALTAVAHRKPFYVAASSFKLDRRKKFVIEERPTTEIYHRLKGVRIRNPAFDLTPWPLVKAVITDKGIFKPREIVRILRG